MLFSRRFRPEISFLGVILLSVTALAFYRSMDALEVLGFDAETGQTIRLFNPPYAF